MNPHAVLIGPADGSEAKPFNTIGAALAAANVGDVVHLMGGFYKEAVQIQKPVVIEGDPELTAVVDGAGWKISMSLTVIKGIQFRGDGTSATALAISGQGTTVADCYISGYPTGIVINGALAAAGIIVRNRVVDADVGIMVQNSGNLLAPAWIVNNIVTRSGNLGAGTTGVLVNTSTSVIANNLISHYQTGLEIQNAGLPNSFGLNPTYGIANLFLHCAQAVVAEGRVIDSWLAKILEPVVLLANATPSGVVNGTPGPTTIEYQTIGSGCGAPAEPWLAFDWGFHPSGPCVSGSPLLWNGLDLANSKNAADVGPFGGLFASGRFVPPPGTYRFGWVLLTDAVGGELAEELRHLLQVRDQFLAAYESIALGRGQAVGTTDPLVVPFDSEIKRILDLAAMDWPDLLAAHCARRYFESRRDDVDFLHVVVTPTTWNGQPLVGGTDQHISVQFNVAGVGKTGPAALMTTFGAEHLLGVALETVQVGFAPPSQLANMPNLYPTEMLVMAHESVGHQFGIGALPLGLGAGHFSPAVVTPDGDHALDVMYARPWLANGGGTSFADANDPTKLSKLHPLLLYAMGAMNPDAMAPLAYLTFPGLAVGVVPAVSCATGCTATSHDLDVGTLLNFWGGPRRQHPPIPEPEVHIHAVTSVVAAGTLPVLHVHAKCASTIAFLGLNFGPYAVGANSSPWLTADLSVPIGAGAKQYDGDLLPDSLGGWSPALASQFSALGPHKVRAAVSCTDKTSAGVASHPMPVTGYTVVAPPVTASASCSSAIAMPAFGGQVTAAAAGASSMGATCGTGGAAPEVVFSWLPPADGVVRVSSCGTPIAHTVAVRIGACGALAGELRCDFAVSCANGFGATFDLAVKAGEPHYFIVDGEYGEAGAVTLQLTPGSGLASYAAPVPLGSGAVSVDGSTCGTPPCTAVGSGSEPTVWYEWSPAISGHAIVSTCGSTGPTSLSVNDLTVPSVLPAETQLDCPFNNGSREDVAVLRGHRYRIGLAGGSGKNVAYHMRIEPPADRSAVSATMPIPGTGGTFNGLLGTDSGSEFAAFCSPNCGAQSAEQIIAWTPIATGSALLTLTNCVGLSSPLVYVRTDLLDWSSQTHVAGGPCGPAGLNLALTDVKPGQTRYIVVDNNGPPLVTPTPFTLGIGAPYHPCNLLEVGLIVEGVEITAQTGPVTADAPYKPFFWSAQGGRKVFKWSPSTTGSAKVSLCPAAGSPIDGLVAQVLSGTCENGTLLDAFISQSSCAQPTQISAKQGVDVFIAVDAMIPTDFVAFSLKILPPTTP